MRARCDGFWFCSSLVRDERSASFVNQSKRAVKQNQSKREITFDTQLKTALYQVCWLAPIKEHLLTDLCLLFHRAKACPLLLYYIPHLQLLLVLVYPGVVLLVKWTAFPSLCSDSRRDKPKWLRVIFIL